jgi:hypothetical protein
MDSQTEEDAKTVFDLEQGRVRNPAQLSGQSSLGNRADGLVHGKAFLFQAPFWRLEPDMGGDSTADAGNGDDDHQVRRALVEEVVRDDQDRTTPRLFMAAYRIQVREPDLAS